MLDVGFTQLGIVGGIVFTLGLYMMAEHNKFTGLWVSYFGIMIVLAGLTLHVHKVLAAADVSAPQASPSTPEKSDSARPYIGFSVAAVFLNSPEIGKVTAWIRQRNAGPVPAHKLRGWFMLKVAPSDSDPFGLTKEPENEVVLMPGHEVNMSSTQPLDATVLEAIKNKTHALFLWGRVDYQSKAGEPFYISFKGRMNGPITTVMVDGRAGEGWGFEPIPNGYEAN